MFEISQLRCFVAVGDELHFGRAAERLHMTQPPLSRQIRLLEHQVGTPLLERTNRVVRFTAAGKVFFIEATRILRLADEAATTARRIANGEGVDCNWLYCGVWLRPAARDDRAAARTGAGHHADAEGDGHQRAARGARQRPTGCGADASTSCARRSGNRCCSGARH